MAGGAADRAGPLAVDLDEPEPGASSQRRIRSVSSAVAAGTGPGPPRTVSPLATSSATYWWASAPGGITPAAASRPWRTTCTAQRAPSEPVGSSSRRAATSWGMRVRAVSRWVRATARTNAASRSRWTPASSNRSPSASEGHPPGDQLDHVVGPAAGGCRAAAAPPRRTSSRRRCRHTATGSGPSRRARTPSPTGWRAMRWEHWRTGNVSWSAARHFSAVLLLANGPT